jgi:hypothetical protein
MLVKKIITKACFVVSIALSFTVTSAVSEETYAPYPDKLSAKLVSVRSASSIDVSAETWPGFSRTFSVSLSGIEVPQNSSDVELCQQELAEQALNFVKDYLSNAEKVEIHNMMMKTSADQNVEADIYTEKGSLSKALKSRGFARSTDIEHEEPWC